jgi:hypothetical protein
VLCLQLADTSRARKLLKDDEGGIEMYELADRLNDEGVEPRDSVDDTGVDGLELERAEWSG